jgi:hypothetical protein
MGGMMLDLHALGSVPRRAAALIVFAGPALALWAWLPTYDGVLASQPAVPSFSHQTRPLDSFAKDSRLVQETARQHGRKLAPVSQPGPRAVQIKELHGLYARDSFIMHLDVVAEQEWSKGDYIRSTGLKLAVGKNLFLRTIYDIGRGLEDHALHGTIAGLFLICGFGLMRWTRPG